MLAPVVHRTRLDYSATFSAMAGADVYLKLENQQKTGSFKVRGAFNCIANLAARRRDAGVIASSAGNHAQGVAYAANAFGISATVVMPRSAPLAKQRATEGYGARVVLHGRNYDEAQAKARQIQEEQGLTFVHPFDDIEVICGQGTIGAEIVEHLPEVDAVLVPVGGGGLAAGVAVAVKNLSRHAKVIGVQAAAAPAMTVSWQSGILQERKAAPTLADGLAVRTPGSITFPYLQRHLDGLVTVSESAIADTIALLLERTKMLVEGAGAVGLAALLAGDLRLEGQKVAVLISGGNIDVARLLPEHVRQARPDAATALR